jgi:hypothetical protein
VVLLEAPLLKCYGQALRLPVGSKGFITSDGARALGVQGW